MKFHALRIGRTRLLIASAATLLTLGAGGSVIFASPVSSSSDDTSISADETLTPTPTASETPSDTPAPTDTPSPTPTAGSNHGALVSAAAHSCPRGAGGVHGKCVSAVARPERQKPPNHRSHPKHRKPTILNLTTKACHC